jgi:hypothetical protein
MSVARGLFMQINKDHPQRHVGLTCFIGSLIGAADAGDFRAE